MTMVVYGAIAQVSIGGLFLGGIIPGILIGLFLMGTVKLYTYHPNYPELRVVHGRFNPREIVTSLKTVWPALVAPIIIVGGILSGVFTATEAGVVACLYAFVVGFFFYRKIRLADLVNIFVESAITTTMVSAVIAVSGAMGWLLAYMQFNDMAVGWGTSAPNSPLIVLLVFAGGIILLGTFVDSPAILLVFSPVGVEQCKAHRI